MKLTCNKCHHEWEGEPEPGQQVVMCPECMNIVPLVLATKGSAPPAGEDLDKTKITPPPKAPEKPAPPPPRPEIPDQKTIILPDEEKIPSPTQAATPGEEVPDKTTVRGDIHDQKTMRLPPEGAPPPEPERISPTPGVPVDLSQTRPPTRQKTPTPAPKAPTPAPPPGEIPTPMPEGGDGLIGKNIEGYRVEKLLGKGGMGAVYLAHQVSLDRKVALKVLPSRYSQNPELIARFTREALSAAQLNHHNIIQVYDVGSVGDIHYISMEYVRGTNIGDMIRGEGRLQLDDAAGYVLQAARGLKYAHERGIIHRDIKPDNLMVNEHGIVKIMDMGLAKWRKDIESSTMSEEERESRLKSEARTDLTMANVALGTPAYMSPEQAQDATSVDARADQYSLGCTFYYMCAGTAPFSGTTVFELISKHLNEPITPLDVHIQNVPAAFSAIIEHMLEKKPEERYPTMDGVIKQLEAYLGVDSEKGPYTPREHHLALLEQEQKRYYAVATLKRRKLIKLAFFSLMPLLLIISLFSGNFSLAGGILGLFILTPAAGFAINGIVTKEYLFRRVRSVFFRMSLKSWAAFILGAVLGVLTLHILGWLSYWIGFAIVSIGVAIAYQVLVHKRLRSERIESIRKVQLMLKELRVRGVSENALHDFVCRFGGVNWEEFFEEFFGYEAMILARGKWAAVDKVKPRKKFAIWREPLARWLEGIEEARKTSREKKQLAKAEARRLKARGVGEKEAEKKAEEEATKILKKGLIRKVEEEKPKKKARRVSLAKFNPVDIAVRLVCLVAGLGVLVAALANVLLGRGIDALSFVINILPTSYYSEWGWGGSPIAVGAGLFLFFMTFSRRLFLRIVTLLGVILFVLAFPLISLVDQPQFNSQTAFWGGIVLVLIGFGYSLFSKTQGGKF